MRKRATLKELAQALDLSVATVSRALSGYDDVAPATRVRVREMARTLGYAPNMAGRMLVSGRTGFVGLVLPMRGPSFVDSFLGDFVTGLGEGLVNQGADLFIATVTRGQSELEVLRHIVHGGRADGVVLTRIAEDDPRVQFLIEARIPFVAHGRTRSTQPFAWLDTDGAEAFGRAFELLYELGHRRFGLVSIGEAMSFRADRESGLTGAIGARGDPSVTLAAIRAPRFDPDAHRAAIRERLAAPDRPTALVCLFDELALIAMQEAQAMGLSVPGDLSVVGFDNVPAAGFATPGLTTFDQATRESARMIAGMLGAQLDAPESPVQTKLCPARLILRESHGPAP